jgi:hypothetical protein
LKKEDLNKYKMSVQDSNPNERDNFTLYYEDLAQFLKPTVVLVFGKIKRTSHFEGFSYMPEPRIAQELGMDRGTVSDAIDKLVEIKLIVDVTKQNWNRYQQILIEQGYKKSNKYSKRIHLYSPDMDRYDELVANNTKTTKIYSYEEVFGENLERGKTRIRSGKNPDSCGEKPEQNVEKPELNVGNSPSIRGKTTENEGKFPMNIEGNIQEIKNPIKKQERKNKEEKETGYASSFFDSPSNSSGIENIVDDDWGTENVETETIDEDEGESRFPF